MIIKRTNSPFTNEVLEYPFPQKFRLLKLESYDGHIDPLDHIKPFKKLLNLQKTSNEALCRSVPTTLKGQLKFDSAS